MLLNCGVGEDTKSPLDCKEIKPVNLKGNHSWILLGRTDAEAGDPILWPPDTKNWLTGKDPDAGKDWRQEKDEKTEDEMVGWMASPTRWTWVWASSGFGVLQSTRLQRIRHDWAIELTAPFYFLKYVGAGVKKVGYICIWSKYTAKCQNGHRKKLSVVLKMCVLLLAPRAAGWREEWEKKGRQRDHWHASRWERRLQFQSVTMWKESSGTMRQSKMRVWL